MNNIRKLKLMLDMLKAENTRLKEQLAEKAKPAPKPKPKGDKK